MSAYSRLIARIFDCAEGGDPDKRDFEARLDRLAGTGPDRLDWRRSIVDLLKALDLDASYGARKALAIELGYTQDLIDAKGSTEMNLWLHAEIMRRLAEGGAETSGEAAPHESASQGATS